MTWGGYDRNGSVLLSVSVLLFLALGLSALTPSDLETPALPTQIIKRNIYFTFPKANLYLLLVQFL